jgi:hypothetical protein
MTHERGMTCGGASLEAPKRSDSALADGRDLPAGRQSSERRRGVDAKAIAEDCMGRSLTKDFVVPNA